MDTSNKFSCFIIGEGTLPIQCAGILLDREHTIYGIISSDLAVTDWARERGIPHIDPKNKDIVTFLSQHPFEYLFSIVNMYILPEQVLALPRRCAINFHDAPLPRYAGSYATSWAIMQGERVHGVTWHAMTELVDAGDIFKQYLFEIDDGETAFTLNAKCYDAAIASFAGLIDDIACDRISARKQDLNERTFFSLDKRPPSGCVLSWNRSARDIGAFVRALDFGSYPNPIGLPKLALGMDVIIVSEVEVLNSMPAVPPGTVTHLAPGFVSVSTMDGEIALRKLLTIDGQPLPIADFAANFGLYEGYQFKELDQEAATGITAYNASICQHEAFWTKHLETLENITLPYAHWKTPSVPTARCLCVPMPVPAEIINPLENRYATGHRGDVLLAAFPAYLARITGVWSFDIGYRDIQLESDVADLEGIFAAHVPLHVGMEHEQSFEEVFHAVQEQVKLAKKRKTYARDIMARYPSLRTKANLQGVYLPSICIERVEALHDFKASHGSELTLVIQEDGLECLWLYNAEVLDEESVVQMQQGFTAFLQGIVSDPQQYIADLPLLTEKECLRLLVEWNATHSEYPTDTCIHQLFEAQVERSPEAVAVVFEDEQLTYQDLNRRANQLAHHLRKLGVGPEVLVGICVERSLDMVVGLLGILKARGAYVPLDPSHPNERLSFMLNDADAAVLVTQQYIATRIPMHGIKIVCLDSDAGVLAEESATDPTSAVTADDLAYVIYTSGSTGQPKGVQITHRSLLNLVFWHQRTFEVTASDRATQFASPSFDVTVEELWPYLTIGASVYIPDEGTRIAPTLMRDWLVNYGITITMLPTAMVENLMTLEWSSTTSLRYLLTGGDTLHRYPPASLPFALINNYGPTEATVVATFGRVFPTEHATMLPSIGRPIANAQIYILDEHLRQVPIGCQGELYVGGVGLAKGYLNHPELTAEKFIANPFSDEPEARLYKTGDLACFRPDGQIAFIGRIDDQIKIRGYRIEPNEIMAILNRHPAVQTSMVVAREDIPGNKHLVAYIVVVPGAHITLNSLRSTLLAHLPDYMVPSTFMVLDAFPLTPNGKVGRSALPAPESNRSITEEPFVAPRLMAHYQLKAIWEELLDRRPIGIRDNFFYIGGHSLLAARLVDRIEQVFGKKIAIATLFAEPTIEGLADALQGQEDTSSRAPVRAIQTGGSKRPFFFLHGNWTDNAFFCFPLARYLGLDQPFYVLRPYRFYGPQVPPTLEAMAAAHLESLRDIQAKGPYLLGGFCNGALVAYEIARRLHAEGEVVDLLVLIDPMPLVYPAYLRLCRGIFSRLGDLLRLGQEKQLDWYLHWYLWLKRLLRLVSKYLRLNRRVKHAEGLTFEAFRQDYAKLFDWMASGYAPSSLYPGKITFFWTSESKEAKAFRKEWRSVEKRNEVEIHFVAGDHGTSLTEHLHDLAECLKICLSKVQEASLSE